MIKIAILNFKGGVGKSFLAHQLITGFGYTGVTHDPYGNLANRLPDKCVSFQEFEKTSETFNTVFDCGGFEDKTINKIISICDLIIIPYNSTYESIQSTVQMLNTLKQKLSGKKLLFVNNASTKISLSKMSRTAIDDCLGYTNHIFEIPYFISYHSAVNYNLSIIDMAKKQAAYRKAASFITDLHNKIISMLNI